MELGPLHPPLRQGEGGGGADLAALLPMGFDDAVRTRGAGGKRGLQAETCLPGHSC